MINYAEQTIDKETQTVFNNKIVEHYEEMMRQFYNTNILEKYNE